MSGKMSEEVFEKFAIASPMATLGMIAARAIFSSRQLDKIFQDASSRQYTKNVAFSTCAKLLGEVALLGTPSVNNAYNRVNAEIPVSISAIYQKLRNVEPKVCEALVGVTAAKATKLIHTLKATRQEPIPGYRLRVIDGNYLGRSERRIKELRDSKVASLPGMSVAVYDYATELISALLVDEDGHANERKLTPGLAQIVQEDDLIMADRLYCTYNMIDMLTEREAKFLIRHHGSIPIDIDGHKKNACGRCETGKVTYKQIELKDQRTVTAIVITRDKPLKSGKSQVVLFTNLLVSKELAVSLANLYLKRWKVEEAFRQLTEYLSCEVRTLGYPRAALFAYSLAVTAYNCLRCVKAAAVNRFGTDFVDTNLSMYNVGQELKRTIPGMEIILGSDYWSRFDGMPLKALSSCMVEVAKNIRIACYQKSPRGKKKKKIPVKRQSHVHAATNDILVQRKEKQKALKRKVAKAMSKKANSKKLK